MMVRQSVHSVMTHFVHGVYEARRLRPSDWKWYPKLCATCVPNFNFLSGFIPGLKAPLAHADGHRHVNHVTLTLTFCISILNAYGTRLVVLSWNTDLTLHSELSGKVFIFLSHKTSDLLTSTWKLVCDLHASWANSFGFSTAVCFWVRGEMGMTEGWTYIKLIWFCCYNSTANHHCKLLYVHTSSPLCNGQLHISNNKFLQLWL